MTATNFRELLDSYVRFTADDEYPGLRIAEAAEILARPVPWVDCPTCHGEGVEFAGDEDDIGDGCPACTGTGKATVAQLLAWGQAAAQPLTDWGNYHLGFGDPAVDAVEDWRNRILDTLP